MHRAVKTTATTVLLLSVGLAGCATPQYEVISAKITNNSSKTISKIVYQDCNSTDKEWKVFYDRSIASKRRVVIPLSRSCAHLKAVDIDGEQIAIQRSVKDSFPFEWNIR